jgi:hypothetical protein
VPVGAFSNVSLSASYQTTSQRHGKSEAVMAIETAVLLSMPEMARQ